MIWGYPYFRKPPYGELTNNSVDVWLMQDMEGLMIQNANVLDGIRNQNWEHIGYMIGILWDNQPHNMLIIYRVLPQSL